MNWIDNITSENFGRSFNLRDILTDSIFYPNSGINGEDMEYTTKIKSYVHTDKDLTEDVVGLAMTHHFNQIGYDLIGIHNVKIEGFGKFILWAVYQLRPNVNTQLKSDRFSLLHISTDTDNEQAIYSALYKPIGIEPFYIYNPKDPKDIFYKVKATNEIRDLLNIRQDL